MCYERRRAEACVDESAHHALVFGCVFVWFITAVPITKLFAFLYTTPPHSADGGPARGAMSRTCPRCHNPILRTSAVHTVLRVLVWLDAVCAAAMSGPGDGAPPVLLALPGPLFPRADFRVPTQGCAAAGALLSHSKLASARGRRSQVVLHCVPQEGGASGSRSMARRFISGRSRSCPRRTRC